MNRYFYSILLFGIAVASLVTDWHMALAIVLSVVVLFMLINKLGKGIVLMEIIAFLYVYTCIFMPYLGYIWYPKSDQLSFLWKRFMPVNEAIYFGYALPAISIFCLVLTWPIDIGKFASEYDYIQHIRQGILRKLKGSSNTGLVIMAIGIIMSLAYPFIPSSLQFFVLLFYFSSFAGLLYIYFSPKTQYKAAIISAFSIFLLVNALSTGMFTVVAYMSLTIFSFFFLGSKTSMFKKLMVFVFGFLLLIVLQNTKKAYRFYTWGKKFDGNQIELFTNLLVDNISKGDALFEKNTFFPIYMRTNQGFNVALVMKRFPRVYPHDNGKFLATNIASSFVPRFLWPDKPEAGGKFNMKYYTGWTISNWSTNIGPLGEAYGAFGVIGGIIYMALLAFFIRWVYQNVYRLAVTVNPLIICWFPVLFYQVTYSSETDTLQIINALLKTAFFIWLMYKLIPSWFGASRTGESGVGKLTVAT